jgi:hypothetical protein
MYITKNIAKDSSGTPIPRFTQDSDEPLVEEDIIELGLTWRWRQKKGLDYTAEMAEFNGTINTRFAQQMATGELNVGGYTYNEFWPLTPGYIGQGPIGV